jgi:hypothetical protein
MPRKKRIPKRDKRGNPYLDVTQGKDHSGVRVTFERVWYSPPLDVNLKIDFEKAAEELQAEVTGGTLWLQNYLDSGDLTHPVALTFESRNGLEALISTIRQVFKDGVHERNAARETGLAKCQAALTDRRKGARRRGGDRRVNGDRRNASQRVFHKLRIRNLRKKQRRQIADRRRGTERRAA